MLILTPTLGIFKEGKHTLIQIQRREQFTKAADSLNKEPQLIRRAEPHLFYEVTNKRKGTQYHVRISRQNGETFGSCTYKAGLRHNRTRHPLSFFYASGSA